MRSGTACVTRGRAPTHPVPTIGAMAKTAQAPPLHRLRLDHRPLGRTLPRLRGVEHPGRGGPLGRWSGARGRARSRHRCRCRCPRWTSPRPPRCRPGSTSSTGCSRAVWCRARSPCSAASPASASRPCCSRCWRPGPPPGTGFCWSRPRSRPTRSVCGPSGSGPVPPGLLILADHRRRRPSSHAVVEIQPDLVVVDSIQAVADRRPPSGERRPTGVPGSVTQVRECADQLVGLAKARQVATVLVGHVTKDGSLAGPRALEHMVDTVLSFEGDRHHALRLLLAVKHRFGPTGELGPLRDGRPGTQPGRRPRPAAPRRPPDRGARRRRPPGTAGSSHPGGRAAGAGDPHGPGPAQAVGGRDSTAAAWA